jgi:hypothetical protein
MSNHSGTKKKCQQQTCLQVDRYQHWIAWSLRECSDGPVIAMHTELVPTCVVSMGSHTTPGYIGFPPRTWDLSVALEVAPGVAAVALEVAAVVSTRTWHP